MTPRRRFGVLILPLCCVLVFISNYIGEEDEAQHYKPGQPLNLWNENVGPLHNPQERYPFATIPFDCKESVRWKEPIPQTIGQKVVGSELRYAGYDIKFQDNENFNCLSKPLTNHDVNTVINLLKSRRDHLQHSTFRMFLENFQVDGLVGVEHLTEESVPVSGIAGWTSVRQAKAIYQIYTRHNLTVFTNQDKIIQVRLEGDDASLVEIKEGGVYNFQLRVLFVNKWVQGISEEILEYAVADTNYKRLLSVTAGCLILALLVWMSRKNMRKKQTLIRKPLLNESQPDNVFGEPDNVHVLAAFIAAGTQLLVTAVLASWILAISKSEKALRGGIFDWFWTFITLTSMVGGYVMVKINKLYGESRMLRLYEQEVELFQQELQLLSNSGSFDSLDDVFLDKKKKPSGNDKVLTKNLLRSSAYIICLLLPIMHLGILVMLSFISWIKGTTRALSFATILQLCWPWALIAAPLCLFGVIVGQRERNARTSRSSHSHDLPRPIFKTSSLLSKSPVLIMLSGLASFIPVCVEILYIFDRTWGDDHQRFSSSLFVPWGTTALIVVLCSRIAVSQSLATTGDKNQWHWIAFGCGASFSIYAFGLGTIYYFLMSSMAGWYQRFYYWLILLGTCVDVCLLFGSLAFWSGHFLVKSFYQEKSGTM